MLIDRAWKAAKDTETLDAASGVVEEEIKHIYKEMEKSTRLVSVHL